MERDRAAARSLLVFEGRVPPGGHSTVPPGRAGSFWRTPKGTKNVPGVGRGVTSSARARSCPKRLHPRTPVLRGPESKCQHSFPAWEAGQCAASIGGLWPCADGLSSISCTQGAAWPGGGRGLGCSNEKGKGKGPSQGTLPFYLFSASLFRAVPRQAPPGGASLPRSCQHQAGGRRGNRPRRRTLPAGKPSAHPD